MVCEGTWVPDPVCHHGVMPHHQCGNGNEQILPVPRAKCVRLLSEPFRLLSWPHCWQRLQLTSTGRRGFGFAPKGFVQPTQAAVPLSCYLPVGSTVLYTTAQPCCSVAIEGLLLSARYCMAAQSLLFTVRPTGVLSGGRLCSHFLHSRWAAELPPIALRLSRAAGTLCMAIAGCSWVMHVLPLLSSSLLWSPLCRV